MIIQISHRKHVVTPYYNILSEMVLKRGHNIYSTELKNATLNLSNIPFLVAYVNYILFDFLIFQTLTFTVLEIQSCLSNGSYVSELNRQLSDF